VDTSAAVTLSTSGPLQPPRRLHGQAAASSGSADLMSSDEAHANEGGRSESDFDARSEQDWLHNVRELYQGVMGSVATRQTTVLSSCDTNLVCVVVMLSA
jgi:hypothetical protein